MRLQVLYHGRMSVFQILFDLRGAVTSVTVWAGLQFEAEVDDVTEATPPILLPRQCHVKLNIF